LNVVVIGSNGQLGSELILQLEEKHSVVGLSHRDIEITDIDIVAKVLKNLKADVVINTAAYHNLSDCNKNPGLSFQVNGIGALNLAQVASDMNFKLVHYSTDNVFDGEKKEPYIETDQPNPLNIFALTKLNGEFLIKNYCYKRFILRTSALYGNNICRATRNNFIINMKIAASEEEVVKMVNDEVLTPTSVSEVAHNTLSLIETEAYGLYHMTCEGQCSWFDFAGVVFKELGLNTPLISCSSNELSSEIKRPMYSVLENENLNSINLNFMTPWEDALKNFLRDN
jgi:dTDP-4-dehydrorhamnose reductase